jgi:exopolyphosphatase/guanosine-5'-triphosphate,3'-diphosphate pyrophosphatase
MAACPFDTIAAVDLGSNSFHMVVADVGDGRPKVIDRMRDPVRLAAGLDERSRLRGEAIQRAMMCLTRFGERVRGLPAGSVRVVGTNTLRKARNSFEFIAQAEVALGHPIDIISGHEEARLIYLGVSHGLEDDSDMRLVIDVGGGSSEFILGRHFEPMQLESLHMGCVGMSLRYFGDGLINRERMQEAELSALQEIESIESSFRSIGWQSVIGASGTVLAVGNVLRNESLIDDGITPGAMRALRDKLVAGGSIEAPLLDCLSPDRKPVFPGGFAILLAAFEGLGIERMRVSESALREGVLYDLLGRISREDVREQTVRSLAERYRTDPAQAQRVATTAASLFEQATAGWDLGAEDGLRLLRWAATLHEIGMAISHSQYHKHGSYLLTYLDMPGFARGEQRRLAALVRGHRRKIPLVEFGAFDDRTNARLMRLCLLLRVAVVLHRARHRESLPEVRLSVEDRQLKLRFPGDWLAAHALTDADLEQEAEYQRAVGFKLKYK